MKRRNHLEIPMGYMTEQSYSISFKVSIIAFFAFLLVEAGNTLAGPAHRTTFNIILSTGTLTVRHTPSLAITLDELHQISRCR